MTPDEAKQILITNRPDRPKSTERRQLQKAIDIILEALEERRISQWVFKLHGAERDYYTCIKCGYTMGNDTPKFCPGCGAYMGIWETTQQEV